MSAPSLLSFLDAPLVVGDPEGRAAYVNPAFETRFGVTSASVTGQPLASLFEGGVREAVLQAVAVVCSQGRSARFRVRHAGVGYGGLASPIVVEDQRVGFLILLSESGQDEERALALQRQLREPLSDVTRILDELGDAAGARRSALLEDALRTASRMRKVLEELGELLGGGASPRRPDAFDPARVVGDVAARSSRRLEAAGIGLEVRVPAALPPVRGDGRVLAESLSGLLEARLARGGPGRALVLSAHRLAREGVDSVIVALVEPAAGETPGEEPSGVRRALAALGGELRVSTDASGARTTAIRLPAAKL